MIYYTMFQNLVSTLSVKNFNLEIFEVVPVLSHSEYCIIYNLRNQTELVGGVIGDLDYITFTQVDQVSSLAPRWSVPMR